MTRNQIEYWSLQERKRSNLANEAEAARSNRAKESYNLRDLAEKQRHNTQTEVLNLLGVEEEVRKNKASEGIKQQEVDYKRSDTVYDNISGTALGVVGALTNLLPWASGGNQKVTNNTNIRTILSNEQMRELLGLKKN